jgi:hypothetical protein
VTHESHQHHEHAHDEAEAFPRRLLASLIAGGEERSRARARWQSVCVGLGIAALALAFPTRALVGDGPEFVRACDSGAWVVVHLALAPLARLLALCGLGIEQAWFVLSAVSAGVCAVAAWKSLVRHGARARAALIAAAIALGAPAAWFAATLPGAAAPGMLGAWLVFGALLDAQREPEREDRHRKLALALFLALLLDVRAIVYVPAILVEAWSTGRARDDGPGKLVRRALALVPAVAVFAGLFALAAFALPSAPAGFAFVERAFDGLLGRGPGGIGSLWLAICGVGTAAFGLVVLVLPPVDREERRPPLWIAVWCVAPLVLPALNWAIDAKAVACALLPPAALGLASWLGDREWSDALRNAALFLAGQAAVGFGFTYGVTSADPNLEWKEHALAELQPGDVLLTTDPDHAYLARHRFGLDVVDLNEPLALTGELRVGWWNDVGRRLRTVIDAGGRAAFDLGGHDSDYGCRTELLRLGTQVPHVEL